MSKKDKVSLVRSEDFEAVDQELAEAMALLDSVNDRVNSLLQAVPEPDMPVAAPGPPASNASGEEVSVSDD